MKQYFIIALFLSIVSIIISGIVLAHVYPTNNLTPDYLGIIISLLALSTTFALGWNIFTAISLKQEWDKQKEETQKIKEKMQQRRRELDDKIQEMVKRQNAFRFYGYAITDFCQVYTKLEPEKKEYWSTYCKTLNAFKNFLETEESLKWYAPACIKNMKSAKDIAIKLKENCSEEINKDIEKNVNEIRTCKKQGFCTYWEQITILEKERKDYLNNTINKKIINNQYL